MNRQIIILLIVLCTTSKLHAQSVRRDIKKGNEAYRKGNYEQASKDYLKAAQKDTNSFSGLFNLGNALYQKKQYEQARAAMSVAANKSKDAQAFANANYNAGNTYLEEKKWAEAIEHYKNALRKNPQDADAKYNLAYAQKMMPKEGSNKNKEDKKDNNQAPKDKDNNKQQQQQQDKKDQQQAPQNKEQQERTKQQPQPSKFSKEKADQMLDALQQEEKKVQDKMRKGQAVPIRQEKDW